MSRGPGLPTAAGLVLAAHPLLVLGLLGGAYAALEWGLEGIVVGGAFVIGQWVLDAVRGPRGLPGPLASPAEQPEVAALVRSVAERAGFREPLAVALLPVPDAGLGKTRIHGAKVLLLMLGLPLVARLTEAQLASVVAHELAHRHHLEDRRSRWVLQARQALAERVDDGARLPRLLGTGLLKRTQPLSFSFELECDAQAARTVGSEAVRGALVEADVLAAGFFGMAARWVAELEEQGEYPIDLYDAYFAAVSDPLIRERVLSEVVPTNDQDSHPGREQRVAALHVSPAGPYSDEPVALRRAEQLVERGLAELVDTSLKPVRVLDDPARVETRAELAAEVVDDIAGVSTLDELLALLDSRPLELPEDARDALVGASARLLSGTLQARGWTKASPWSSSLLVDDKGAVRDLRALMGEALTNPQARGRVRALVAT